MSAGSEVQKSIVGMLGGLGELTGVWDGPPARAPYPYAVVDAGRESDWGTKDRDGREIVLAVTLWDEQPERLYTLSDQVEDLVRNLGDTDGWQTVSARLLKRRVLRDVAGPWAVGIDFRVRLLAA